MICPYCKHKVLKKDINISDNVVLCFHCKNEFRPSECYEIVESEKLDINNPPDGVWIKQNNYGLIVGATLLSPVAFIAMPFLLIWTIGLLSAIVQADWNLIEVELELALTFSIFFILAAILWPIALIKVFGKIEIHINHKEGRLFTGIAKAGISRCFDIDDILAIDEKRADFEFKRENSKTLVFKTKSQKDISLWFGLSKPRRDFLKFYFERTLMQGTLYN